MEIESPSGKVYSGKLERIVNILSALPYLLLTGEVNILVFSRVICGFIKASAGVPFPLIRK